ncbi:helix-turn-helix domain-containing protein [Carnobacterium maltaromaticum]|uniref:helix-turn-helix domain-containing protein n=1 Tax=Carnobacterium maltaromaticum TaxID=2751 RepID=UPI0039BE3801
MYEEKELKEATFLDNMMKKERNSTNSDQKIITFNLKELLAKRCKNVADLYRATNISKNSLGQLVSGESQGIQFVTLAKILYALNISIEYLLTYTPPKSENFSVNLENIEYEVSHTTDYNIYYEQENSEVQITDRIIIELTFECKASDNQYEIENRFNSYFW